MANNTACILLGNYIKGSQLGAPKSVALFAGNQILHVIRGQIDRLAVVSCSPAFDWRLRPLVPRSVVSGMTDPVGRVRAMPSVPRPIQIGFAHTAGRRSR
ncbi:hypothetical protein N7534_003557 [Penicillium rubens]|nr:hypothetical protein N7524_003621 [Penicillium chrysogenum]KAJ5858280.1 hypothetical protein N7534_003557 [Penicillium rubens]